MKDLIDKYIVDKELAWSSTTQRSERFRLYAAMPYLNGDPSFLWANISYMLPYSKLTTWTRVVGFWNFLIELGVQNENKYEAFRKKNAKVFKNTYNPKYPTISFEEATSRIRNIRNEFDRDLALQIIGSGERYSEAIQETSIIIGKGSKQRHTFRPGVEKAHSGRSYSSFRGSLKSVGLKPHDLRKLFATKLVEKGLKETDLLKIMGWSSMSTAKAYLQPKREEELKSIIDSIHGELK